MRGSSRSSVQSMRRRETAQRTENDVSVQFTQQAQEILSEEDVDFIEILRDPDGYIERLSAAQKVAFFLWRHTGDVRLAAVVFPKQFPQEVAPLLRVHTPIGAKQFSLIGS